MTTTTQTLSERFDPRMLAALEGLDLKARFYVVCDSSASMNYRGSAAWGSKLECARVLAAALTWFLLKQNDAAGMVSLSPSAGERAGLPSIGLAKEGVRGA